MHFRSIHDSQVRPFEIWSPKVVTAFLGCACILGWMIASEKWIFVCGAFGLLLLFLRPLELSLGLYACLIPFESMTTLEGSGASVVPLLRYLELIAICTTLGVGWLSRRIRRPPKTALFWSLFILWAGASILWSIDPDTTLRRLPAAVGLWLLYLVVVSVRMSIREVSWITLLSIVGGCGASLYSVYIFIRTGGSLGRGSIPDGATQADPNFFALTLLLPLSLACGEALSSRSSLRRLFFFAATMIIFIAVFLTMSRGALAAVTAIIIVFFVRFRMNWRVVVPVTIAGAALLLMPRLFFERMQEASDSRLSGRQDIWIVGIHSLARYGAFGAGLDNFQSAFQEYEGTSLFFAGDARDAHNIYLATSVELGFVGVFCLIAAVRTHFKSFPRFDRTNLTSARIVAFEAACWAGLVAGLTLNILWRKAFWWAWALSLAAAQVVREDRHAHDS